MSEPNGFPFPFTPYPLQLDVMRFIRSTIKAGRVGVVESPTGTGKSQMLLNGVLSTVFDSKDRLLLRHEQNEVGAGRKRERLSVGHRRARRQAADPALLEQDDDPTTLPSSSSSGSDSSDDDCAVTYPKVLFASRTHSQLAQLCDEIRRTVFCPRGNGQCDTSREFPLLKFVHLASRAQLCINTRLCHAHHASATAAHATSHVTSLNDACRDAVAACYTKEGKKIVKEFWRQRERSSTVAGCGSAAKGSLVDIENVGAATSCQPCPYADKSRLRLLMEHARASSRSLDEMKTLGKELGACPFLATKALAHEADVVFLPYPYLVDPVARAQLLPNELFDPEATLCRGDAGNGERNDVTPRLVLVFDEAHHVADVVRSIGGATITAQQIALVLASLRMYQMRYDSRLLSHNKTKIRELSMFFTKLLALLLRRGTCNSPGKDVMASVVGDGVGDDTARFIVNIQTLADALFDGNLDHVNVFPMVTFLEETRLVFKLASQSAALVDSGKSAELDPQWLPLIRAAIPEGCSASTAQAQVQSACFAALTMLRSLCVSCVEDETAVLYSSSTAKGAELSVISTAGRGITAPLFQRASSVLLAGGTLQPLSLLLDPLMPPEATNESRAEAAGAAPRRLYEHISVPHIIPPSSLRVMTLGVAPNGTRIDCTYANRKALSETWDGVAMTIVNLCRIIPGGVIVCFTSYAMEASFSDRIQCTGVMDQLQAIKKVFRETRNGVPGVASSGGQSVDALLHEYRAWIQHCLSAPQTQQGHGMGGAVMLCVMGGKLSEGINFNDHLGRAVIGVGIPYPRPQDAVLNLTIASAASASRSEGCSLRDVVSRVKVQSGVAGEDEKQLSASVARRPPAEVKMYHAVAMRAVNQAVGRCIRHANDYAVIILLDCRYRDGAVWQHLPSWMQPSLHHCNDFRECFSSVRQFFETHK